MAEPATLPPELSGARPVVGHGLQFLRDPLAVLERGRAEHGEMFTMHFFRKPVIAVLGSALHRRVAEVEDEALGTAAGREFMGRMFDDDFFFCAGREQYLRDRALMLPQFRASRLEDYLPIMREEIDAWLGTLGEEGEFDLNAAFRPLTLRIAVRTYLGDDFARRHGDEWYEDFQRFEAGLDPVMPGWLPLPHLLRAKAGRRRLRAAVGRRLSEVRAGSEAPDDFLYRLCHTAYPDGSPVGERTVLNTVLFLMFAGFHTVVGQSAWAVVDLLAHPEELARFDAEQEQIGPVKTMSDVNRRHFLDAFLRESGRLHPVAFVFNRGVDHPIELGGHRLPAGVSLLFSPVVSQRLEADFEDPERFCPARFEDAGARQRMSQYGIGKHRCIGAGFAVLEMKILLVQLVGAYRLELLDQAPELVPGTQLKGPASPCRVHYRRR